MEKRHFVWKLAGRELLLGERTLLMGVLNVTPDSFSDGGLFIDPERALEHALAMEADGAAIIDVGGESTRPQGAQTVPHEVELARVAVVLFVEGLHPRL